MIDLKVFAEKAVEITLKRYPNYYDKKSEILKFLLNDKGINGYFRDTELIIDFVHKETEIEDIRKWSQSYREYFRDLASYEETSKRLLLIKEFALAIYGMSLEEETIRLINGGVNTGITKDVIKNFSDLIDSKYHPLIPALFKLLGKHFPEYYNNDGIAISSKRYIKSILANWYNYLKKHNFLKIINPTNEEKSKIASIFLEKCKFSDQKLSAKSLFTEVTINDRDIEINLKQLEKSIKSLKDNLLN